MKLFDVPLKRINGYYDEVATSVTHILYRLGLCMELERYSVVGHISFFGIVDAPILTQLDGAAPLPQNS